MKKYIVAFFMFLLLSPCFALEKPRWIGLPIYVYIPEYGRMSVLMKQKGGTGRKLKKNLHKKFKNTYTNLTNDVIIVSV